MACATTEKQDVRTRQSRHLVQINQGIIWVVWPGDDTSITPAHIHISFEVLFKAGWLANSTVGAPGIQGAGVLGIHGIGVNAPIAAAVAAATVGLAKLLHTPNGMMFIIGT